MIDLHAHTTISDGSFSPRELILLAKKLHLSAVAITDHDSIEGHGQAQEAADQVGVKLIKGIEFDAVYQGKYRMHILGLNIDGTKERFLEIYNHYRQGKEKPLEYLIESLRKMGVELQRQDLLTYQVGDYLDRQAIAKYLVKEGYTDLIKYSWINYLDKIPMTQYDLIEAQMAIEAIHAAGGKAFLAHYHLPLGLGKMTEEKAIETLRALKGYGLDGMEYYYPSFTSQDQDRCGHYIKMFDFDLCGGSDFHGKNRAHIQLGIGDGNFQVPDQVLKNVYAKEKP